MEVLLTTKGKSTGNIDISHSLKTMKVGESWSLEGYSLGYLRVLSSRVGRVCGMFFSVPAPAEGGPVVITRKF